MHNEYTDLFKIRLKTQLNGTGILSFPPFWRGKQLILIILIFISSISAILKYALYWSMHYIRPPYMGLWP